jgi:hypothetical protein
MSELIQLREPDPPSAHELAALARIRRWRFAPLLAFLAFLPAVALVVHMGLHEDAFFFGWLGLLVVCLLPSALARCPRCKRLFHMTGGWHNYWSRACLHCGFGEKVA